jgi:hypothetical protein
MAGIGPADAAIQKFAITGTYDTWGTGQFPFTGTAIVDLSAQTINITWTVPDIDPISVDFCGPYCVLEYLSGASRTMAPVFTPAGDGPYAGGTIADNMVTYPAGWVVHCGGHYPGADSCDGYVADFQGTLIPTVPIPAGLLLLASGASMLFGWPLLSRHSR